MGSQMDSRSDTRLFMIEIPSWALYEVLRVRDRVLKTVKRIKGLAFRKEYIYGPGGPQDRVQGVGLMG